MREVAAIIKHAKNVNTLTTKALAEDAFLAVLADDYPSLLLERALIEIDYRVCQQLSHEELTEGLSRLQRKINEGLATKDLQTLCNAKCDRVFLLWLLHWFSNEPIFPLLKNWVYKPGVRTAKQMFGITSKQLRKLVSEMNDIAMQVEKVNRRFEFGILMSVEHLWPLLSLQRFLRLYSKLLQDGARHFGRGSDGYHNIAKGRLTTYVRIQTGKFHDKEVAALISAVSGNEKYDETSHRRWRGKHYERLKTVDPYVCIPKR
jgi:hypothetical protein